MIAHEAVRFGGFGAELASTIATEAFGDLVAPIERVGAPFAPVPASPALEASYVPDAAAIAEAARRTMAPRPAPSPASPGPASPGPDSPGSSAPPRRST